MRAHLERLRHTRLRAIQWININRYNLEFTTLANGRPNRIMAGQNHKPEANRADATREIGDLNGWHHALYMILSSP